MKKNIIFVYNEKNFKNYREAFHIIHYVLTEYGIAIKRCFYKDSYIRETFYQTIETNVANVMIMDRKSFSMEIEMISQFNNIIYCDIEALLDYLTELSKQAMKSLYPKVMICDEVKTYFDYDKDMEQVKELVNALPRLITPLSMKPEIIKVTFNEPATIVFWSDGTKTVVKAIDEPFDKEKGLAMAISKKFLGNNVTYYNEFKKWLPEDHRSLEKEVSSLELAAMALSEGIKNAFISIDSGLSKVKEDVE